ncbi:MAG TPA: hypothetical protein VMI06_17005 [Terriglobia bacterium]|nr:hypothetical protein [Terriglobia bacterium]
MRKHKSPSDELRAEYKRSDFTELQRGKYYQRVQARSNVVMLDPDVAEIFPNSAAANEGLHHLLLMRMKYKDFEIEFGRDMAEVRAEATEELPLVEAGGDQSAEEQRLADLAKTSPRAAIAEAWRQVELAASLAVRRNEIPLRLAEVTATHVMRSLERHRVIDPGKIGLMHDLRGLRNQAVHAPDFAVSTEAALEYVQLAQRMREYLQTARPPVASER